LQLAVFKETEPDVVLQKALESQRKRTRVPCGRGAAGETRRRVDYTTPQHAGDPHRGIVSEEEAKYVREHLDEVNARLRENNQRQIDPTDPRMAERYGLTQVLVDEPEETVEEAELVAEEPPRG
jgi:hypothetical protein